MHRVDYSKKVDSNSNSMMMNNSASAYMVDLTDKLTLVREEVLGGYRVSDLAKEWLVLNSFEASRILFTYLYFDF